MSKKEIEQEEVQGTAKKKGGKGKTILIVIVVLIIIGAIGSMNKKDSESSGSSSSETTSSKESLKESSNESNKSTVDVNDAEAVKAAFKAGDFSMVSEDVKKLLDEMEEAEKNYVNVVKGKQASEYVSDPVYQESLEIVTKNTIQLDLALGKSKNPADKLYKEYIFEKINEGLTANGLEPIK
jgi:hypothetical protein